MAYEYPPNGGGFFQPLTDYISRSMVTFLDWLKEGAIDIINWCIEALSTGLTYCLDLLPEYSLTTCTQYFNNFSNSNAGMPKAVTAFNFFFPMDCFIAILTVWLASEVAYIAVAPILRWFKLIAR